MSRQQLWIGILALAAGAALAYVETRRYIVPPPPAGLPPAADAGASANCAPPPPKISASPAAPHAVAATPEPQPTLALPAPDISAARPIVCGRTMWYGVVPDSQPVRQRLPLQGTEKLWDGGFDLNSSATAKAKDGGIVLDNVIKSAENPEFHGLSVQQSDIGTAYSLFKNDDTTFSGRFAGGLSRDYDGLKDGQVVPELLFGVQFEHAIDDRNKIIGEVDFARDVTESGRNRTRSQAAWEVLLDPEKNVSLRTGIQERANKAPGSARVKDLDYSLDVIWKF